jgi:tetratricopeptide (TPR) repeat protein
MKERFGLFAMCIISISAATLLAQTARMSNSELIDPRRYGALYDTANFSIFLTQAVFLAEKDIDEALACAKKAKSIALNQQDTARIVHSSRLIGQLYNRQGHVTIAIEELAPLVSIAEKNNFKDELKKILNSLAISFNNLGEYDRALDYHLKSLSYKVKDNDEKGIAVSLNNIGVLYYRMDNHSRALHYWTKCLELKLATNDSYDLDALYLNLGWCYDALHDFEKARENLDKVLPICSPNCTKRILIQSECAKGRLAFHEKNFNKARNYLMTSLDLARSNDDLEYELENLVALAQIGLETNKLNSVNAYLREISAIGGKEQFVASLQSYYKISSSYYFRIGKRELANYYEREYFQLETKINSSEMHRRIMEIQMTFIEKENAEKLQSQQRLVEMQAAIIKNQGVINWLLFGLALLTISLAFVFFKMHARKAAINKRLDSLVRERTCELEDNRNELVHAFNEQKIVLSMILKDLVSSLATISGISNVARIERLQDVNGYLGCAEKVLFHLIESIKRLESKPGSYHRQKNAGRFNLK